MAESPLKDYMIVEKPWVNVADNLVLPCYEWPAWARNGFYPSSERLYAWLNGTTLDHA